MISFILHPNRIAKPTSSVILVLLLRRSTIVINMKNLLLPFRSVIALLFFTFISLQTVKPNRYDVAVYYFPQWHVDTANTNLRPSLDRMGNPPGCKPRFTGHLQPKVHYGDMKTKRIHGNEQKIQVLTWKNVFLFDWYYFNKGPFCKGHWKRLS